MEVNFGNLFNSLFNAKRELDEAKCARWNIEGRFNESDIQQISNSLERTQDCLETIINALQDLNLQ